jgi:hypothetical protein
MSLSPHTKGESTDGSGLDRFGYSAARYRNKIVLV